MTEASAKQGGPFLEAWQSSDAVLVVEEKELHVHSMILSLASPYFDKMFNGSFKESQTKRVTLEGKSFDLIRQMLKIIYPNFGCEIGMRNLFWILILILIIFLENNYALSW
eukprot:TCONS_00038547-protein